MRLLPELGFCFNGALRLGRTMLFCLLLGSGTVFAKEQWVKVVTPHFTVLTPANGYVAKTWAMELERYRIVLQEVVKIPESRLRPVTVVLFTLDSAMRPYKPLENGKPQEISGLFINFGDSHAIAVSLDGDPAQVRRIIFHEMVHWYSNAGDGDLPLWLEEGIAEVYSTFTATPEGDCTLGRGIQSHLALLERNPEWSLEEVVSTGRGSLQYNEGNRASVFYAGAWLAVHYILLGTDGPGRSAVLRYLEESTSRSPAEAFQRAFGTDFTAFKAKLKSYKNGGRYTTKHFRQPLGELGKNLNAVAADEAEVQLALATLLIGARPKNPGNAVSMLERAAVSQPDNPVIWQVRGEQALLGENYEDAESYFEKAVAVGSRSYYVFHGLGCCHSRVLRGPQGALDPSAVKIAIKDFQQAIQLNPNYIPAYENLAGLMYATTEYNSHHRDLLETGRRLAPDNLMIDIGLAACDLQGGKRDAGRRRLQLILQTPTGLTPELRTLATAILESEDERELSEKLQVLFEERRYREAVVLIDGADSRFFRPATRQVMAQNRREAINYELIDEAIKAANSGKTPVARALLERLLASEPSSQVTQEAKRLLGEVAKMEH